MRRSEQKLKLYPLIYTSGLSESGTKCGSGCFRARVWIKVCNPQYSGHAYTSDHHAYGSSISPSIRNMRTNSEVTKIILYNT